MIPPDTNSDDASEPFDPVVADRFRLLDRLRPPPLLGPAAAAVGSDPAVDPRQGPLRRPVFLAVAAAAVLIGTVGAAAWVGRGGPTGVETVSPADESDRDSGGQTGGTSAGGAADAGVVEIGPADGAAAITTGSTEAPSSESTSEPSTGPTTTAGDGPAPGDGSLTLPSLIPQDDTIVTLAGVVTEVFTDCQSHLALVDGSVVPGGPVSCDGGSWIVVDQTRVVTSSGFTTSDQAWNGHLADLQPGDRVTVVAIASDRSKPFTLQCPLCQIEIETRGVGLVAGDGTPGSGSDKGTTGELDQPGGPGGPPDK